MSTAKDSKRIQKRILSVTVRRMIDTDADASYLGEYGSNAKSDYAIDRAHSEDCILNDTPQKEKLERIADAIENDRPICDEHLDVKDETCSVCSEEWAYTEAMDAVRGLAECDCSFSGHWNNREHRYFNPNHESHAGLPETDIRKYCRQDFDRAESLNNGNWCYIGIRAEAEYVLTSYGRWLPEKNMFSGGCGPIQELTSGGLYGIESDSGKQHIAETISEELASLKTELLALGFSKRAIATAFKPENIQEKGE